MEAQKQQSLQGNICGSLSITKSGCQVACPCAITNRSIIAITFYNHDHDNQNFFIAIVATCLCTCAVANWSCAQTGKWPRNSYYHLKDVKVLCGSTLGFLREMESFIKRSVKVLPANFLKYSGNTTNLFYHLQHSHHTEFKAMQEARQQGEQERMMKMKDLRQGKVS